MRINLPHFSRQKAVLPFCGSLCTLYNSFLFHLTLFCRSERTPARRRIPADERGPRDAWRLRRTRRRQAEYGSPVGALPHGGTLPRHAAEQASSPVTGNARTDSQSTGKSMTLPKSLCSGSSAPPAISDVFLHSRRPTFSFRFPAFLPLFPLRRVPGLLSRVFPAHSSRSLTSQSSGVFFPLSKTVSPGCAPRSSVRPLFPAPPALRPASHLPHSARFPRLRTPAPPSFSPRPDVD